MNQKFHLLHFLPGRMNDSFILVSCKKREAYIAEPSLTEQVFHHEIPLQFWKEWFLLMDFW